MENNEIISLAQTRKGANTWWKLSWSPKGSTMVYGFWIDRVDPGLHYTEDDLLAKVDRLAEITFQIQWERAGLGFIGTRVEES